VTDPGGEFKLPDVKKGDMVIISFIGYVTEERIIQTGQPLTVAMRADIHFIGELVINQPLHKRIFYRVKSWFQ
jgi:hypothetical protein